MRSFTFTLFAIGIAASALSLSAMQSVCAQAPAEPPARSPGELRRVQPLMEGWKFVQDDRLSDAAALAASGDDWQTVSLPHTWNAEDAASLDSTSYVRGLGWYRLEFPTPAQGVRHWLEFGAASLVADVWLNGQHLGQHRGGFTAFRFDVTDVLSPAQADAEGGNVLLVKVNNRAPEDEGSVTAIVPLGGDFNVSGGLYRHVELISTPAAAHLALDDLGGPGVYATTTTIVAPVRGPEGTLQSDANINVRAKVSSEAEAAGEYIVRISLLDASGSVAGRSERSVQLDGQTDVEVSQDIMVAPARLWHGLADPYLYQLVADLVTADGTVIDRVVQSFGIREMRFDPDAGFSLNGEPMRLRGVSMHQDHLGKGWALQKEDFDTSLGFFTDIGANAIRLAHYPYAEYPLERISALGLLAWAEAALGMQTTVEDCAAHDASEEFAENALEQLSEMIRQQYNHAAIAMWSVGNESTITQDRCGETYDNITPLLRAMHERAKREDPSRPTTYAAFADSPVPEEQAFPTTGITDLYATNRYYLWYNQAIDEMSQVLDELDANVSQPLAVSEYGAGGAITHHTDNPRGGVPEVRSAPEGEVSYQPEEYAAYAHEENYRILASKPYLWGTFAWAMFDYGTARRREGDMSGVNTKGLVTFDRMTRKDPYYFYKANWSGEPVTYIVGRRHTERPYPVTDVKVYSNSQVVELTVNGMPVALMTADQCEQRACLFEDVRLQMGPNTITATGNHGGQLVADSVEWNFEAEAIRIAAGRLATGYVASDGARYGSDEFFSGGQVGNVLATERDLPGGPAEVRNTNDPLLYKYLRRGEFRYEIPLESGRYDVRLGFMEPRDADSDRDKDVFDVIANGDTVLESFDVLEAAGAARTAVTRRFSVEVGSDGLVLEFDPRQGEALVSVIEIVPSQ